MRTQDAVAHFGSKSKLAEALNIKPPSVSEWGEFVPLLRQFQLEKITHGKLRAAPIAVSVSSTPAKQKAA